MRKEKEGKGEGGRRIEIPQNTAHSSYHCLKLPENATKHTEKNDNLVSNIEQKRVPFRRKVCTSKVLAFT